MPAIAISSNNAQSIGARYFSITGQTVVLTSVPNGATVGTVWIDGLLLARSDWSYNIGTKTLTVNNIITGTAWGYCQFVI